jgi:hypothetical protein
VNLTVNTANTEVARLRQREADLVKTNELMGRASDAKVPASLEEAFGHWYRNSAAFATHIQQLGNADLGARVAALTGLVNEAIDGDQHDALIDLLYSLVEMTAEEETNGLEYIVLKQKLTEYGREHKANKKDLGDVKAAHAQLKEREAQFVAEVRGFLGIDKTEEPIQTAIARLKEELQSAVTKQEASQRLLAFVAGKLTIGEEPTEDNLGAALAKLAEDIQAEKRAVGEAKTAAVDTLKEIATALDLPEEGDVEAIKGAIASNLAKLDSAKGVIRGVATKLGIEDLQGKIHEKINEKLDTLTAQVAAAERTRDEAIAAKDKFEPIVDALARLLSKPHNEIVETVTSLKAKAETPAEVD